MGSSLRKAWDLSGCECVASVTESGKAVEGSRQAVSSALLCLVVQMVITQSVSVRGDFPKSIREETILRTRVR